MAVSLYELGQYEEAIVYYDKALEIFPDYPKALNNKANAITELISIIPASYYYDNSGVPNYHSVSSDKEDVSVLSIVGKYTVADAIALFDKAMELSPNDNTIICNKANLLTKIGDSNEASVYYEKALDSGHTCPSEQVNIVEPVKVSFQSAK
jgi:tetratricopeptide (TPR) repeat protein